MTLPSRHHRSFPLKVDIMSGNWLWKIWDLRIPVCLLLGILSILALTLSSMSVPEWVTIGHRDFTISGGLLRCTDCPGDLQGKWYGDIVRSELCHPVAQGMQGLCQLLEDLGTAGILFLVGNLLTVVGLLAWVGLLIAKLAGRYDHPCVSSSLCILTTLLHLLSLFLWELLSQASFSHCENILFDNKRPEICISTGPIISFSAILLGFAVVMGFLCYLRASKVEPATEEVSTAAIRFTFGNPADLSRFKDKSR